MGGEKLVRQKLHKRNTVKRDGLSVRSGEGKVVAGEEEWGDSRVICFCVGLEPRRPYSSNRERRRPCSFLFAGKNGDDLPFPDKKRGRGRFVSQIKYQRISGGRSADSF